MNNTTPAKVTYKTFIFSHAWHSRAIGLLVGILMIAIYLWILGGFVSLMSKLYHALEGDWMHAAETMIEEIVIILASLELIRIFQSYLLLGRVKVTFILDVTLVVLIGELISFWYRDEAMTKIVASLAIVCVLVVLRIVTSKYSPDCPDYATEGQPS